MATSTGSLKSTEESVTAVISLDWSVRNSTRASTEQLTVKSFLIGRVSDAANNSQHSRYNVWKLLFNIAGVFYSSYNDQPTSETFR